MTLTPALNSFERWNVSYGLKQNLKRTCCHDCQIRAHRSGLLAKVSVVFLMIQELHRYVDRNEIAKGDRSGLLGWSSKARAKKLRWITSKPNWDENPTLTNLAGHLQRLTMPSIARLFSRYTCSGIVCNPDPYKVDISKFRRRWSIASTFS